MMQSPKTPLAALRRVVAVSKPPPWWLAGAAGALLLSTALGTLPPLFVGKIVDALQAADGAGAMRELALYTAVTIAAGLCSFGESYATTALREAMARTLRVRLMGKLMRARLDRLERLTLGEIANRVNVDVNELCARFEYSLFPSIEGVCLVIATSATMLAIDYRFALASFAAVTLAVLPAKLTAARYTELQRSQMKVGDELAGTVTESATLSALALLRNARAAAREVARFAALADRSKQLRLAAAALGGATSLATTFANLAGPIAVLSLGIYLLVRHETGVGTIVTFLMYQARLYSPVSGLSVIPLQLATIGISAGRVLEIDDLEEERSGERRFLGGPIELCNVHVARGSRSVLSDAALHIPLGARAAIVGESGSGKSTIAALLLRLHDPTLGRLLVGTADLRDVALDELRSAVAVVAQDPLIFDASLIENLTYTNPSASDAAVERAISLCRLDEVIERLPEGLQTRLGQRGCRLSGGERQRICLARAVVQDPEILVLDEALTGVDVATEMRIVDELGVALGGRTLVVITHRLASIRSFDPIVVVESGRIAASGPHRRVCAESAWYRSVCGERSEMATA
ncbi:MAG TPA: ABC transporter ATP-binding protein [Verrucomicrobiae bacterium]|nr:ABC transporter ATP-binding protein [Verrucomicrobiae bacterium]